ncbi:VTT domain-containing protein [Brevundimonas sp. AJA228-03]|uniref:TVP38/TMEM64 family protein n=1 Tax=Brevundimonas sp. AJA228-03 TaxID=2752515 RepID=UPI001ADF0187|nr:VTT domain-containing protein [Brevundimonas sp. AJA228-03]QTN18768.1 VTT domain-containing protein [Brevundimonas sp. AJA228-03]
MRRILDFILNMEGARWRALLASVLLLGAVAALFAVGKASLGLEAEGRLEAWLQGFNDGPLGFAAVVVVFVVSAFLGVPQFILIAASVVAFGPWSGFVYSWIATVVSAGVTYWLGRGPTARAVEKLGGQTTERLARFVGKNAFYASFMIRNVPSAPFIVVNMAFGAARASFPAFLAGCALGVLPKTALVAFFGGSFMSAVRGDGVWTSAILAGVAVVWLGLMLAVREIVKRRENPAD